MMGSTHIAAGVAVSLAVLQPGDASGLACAVAGGALGGLVSDIDVRGSKGGREVRRDLLILGALAAAGVLSDCFTGQQLYDYVVLHFGVQQVVTGLALVGLCVFGMLSAHRSFTHSLLGMVLFSSAMWFFCQPLAPAFAMGVASHIALDVLNKRPVQLLWPMKKGFCLGLCKTGGAANSLVLLVSVVASVGLTIWLLLV